MVHPVKSICIVTTVQITMEEFVIPSARHLKKNGFDVTLVCSMTPEFHSRYCCEFECINLPMERGADFLGMLASVWRLAKLFKSRSFSIIQYSTPNAALYAAVASFLVGQRVRVYGQWGLRYLGFTGFKRFVFKFIEKMTCLLSTHIRPVSQKNLQFAVSEKLYPQSKAIVLGSGGTVGVDLTQFDFENIALNRISVLKEHPRLQGGVVFGYVGRVARDKGFNELILAFRELSECNPSAKLLVLGSFDQKEDPVDSDLLDWALNSPNVLMLGHVNAAKYMSVMDIVVHPSYREGFSMILQQAQALGIATITTDIPGPSEVIEPDVTGILVPAREVIPLLQGMQTLFHNPALREKFGQAGKQRVKNLFERQVMLERILADRLQLAKSNLAQ